MVRVCAQWQGDDVTLVALIDGQERGRWVIPAEVMSGAVVAVVRRRFQRRASAPVAGLRRAGGPAPTRAMRARRPRG